MSKKMTPWFPSIVYPVRAGVYEVWTHNSSANKYAYFDKSGWRLCSSHVGSAEGEKECPDDCSGSSMLLTGSKWRGFTEEQK